MYVLNRVLSESDIDDVRYHIIFEMAMETYFNNTDSNNGQIRVYFNLEEQKARRINKRTDHFHTESSGLKRPFKTIESNHSP